MVTVYHLVNKSLPFVKPGSSLQCSQEPTAVLFPYPDDPSPCVITGFLPWHKYDLFFFWDVTQHRLVLIYRRFGTTCRSRRTWILKLQPIICPETSVNKYQSTPRCISVQLRSQIQPTLSYGVSQRYDVGSVVLPKSHLYFGCSLHRASYIYIYIYMQCLCI